MPSFTREEIEQLKFLKNVLKDSDGYAILTKQEAISLEDKCCVYTKPFEDWEKRFLGNDINIYRWAEMTIYGEKVLEFVERIERLKRRTQV